MMFISDGREDGEPLPLLLVVYRALMDMVTARVLTERMAICLVRTLEGTYMLIKIVD